VPTDMNDMTLQVGWHGPIPVVGAPNRSYDYGVVAPPRAGHPGYPCDSTGGGPLYSFNSLLVPP